MDLPTKIVAEHLATRITDLEVELAEQAAGAVVEGLVFVDGVDKLPAAVAGVRTLAPSTAYYLTTEIDLEGDRLVLSDSTVLLGTSSETAILKSTGLDADTPLLTMESGGPNPIQNLRVEGVGTALYVDGQGGANAALDWLAFNLVDCGKVGTIRDITNLVVNTSAWLNTGGLVLDGSIGTVAFFQTLWTLPAGSGKTAISLPATLTISRRFRWTYSPLFVPPGCTGIYVEDPSTTFPIAESFGILYGNFSGNGTYLSGISYADDEAVIQSTLGATNSSPSAHYYQIGNVTATTITIAGTYYKAAGSPSSGPYTTKFTVSGNRATYSGSVPRFFRLTASAAFAAGNNRVVAACFAVNGVPDTSSRQRSTANASGRVESMTVLGLVLLNPGQYVELWITDESGTGSVTITDLQVTIAAVAG